MFRPGFVDTLYIWAAALLSTAGHRLHWRCPVFYCSCIAILSHLLFHRYFIYCFFIALNTEAANLILSDLSSDNKEIHFSKCWKNGNPEERFVYFREQHGEGIIAGLHFDSVLVGLFKTSPPYPKFNLNMIIILFSLLCNNCPTASHLNCLFKVIYKSRATGKITQDGH